MDFTQFQINHHLLKALTTLHYNEPTPIQVEAIPQLLSGADLLATAQTGTGKTAAFGLPLLEKIIAQKFNNAAPVLKGLILAPTRELADQIAKSLKDYAKYTKVKISVIYGGVNKGPQIRNLQYGTDILVATPGRLLDLMNMGFVSLKNIHYFVLDEADQMLDMGFIPDIKKIEKSITSPHQTMLFSATMPEKITELAYEFMHDPLRIAIGSVQQPIDTITQGVYYVSKENKSALLIHLLKNEAVESALIFCRTKHGSDKLQKELSTQPFTTEIIHGNKGQQLRMSALQNFKSKQSRVLIATDIASRGIDISQISHIFNYDLPQTPETYLHRIGRTGRAGQVGNAISFCAQDEKDMLKEIQKHIAMTIPVLTSSAVPALVMKEEGRTSVKKPNGFAMKNASPVDQFFSRNSSSSRGRSRQNNRDYSKKQERYDHY